MSNEQMRSTQKLPNRPPLHRGAGKPNRPPMGGPMRMPGEKARDFKGTFRRLFTYVKPFWISTSIVLIFAILASLLNILSPKVQGMITTSIFESVKNQTGIDFGYIGKTLLVLAGLFLFSALFNYLQQFLMVGISQKTMYRLRKEVDHKLDQLPLGYFDTKTHGEILSRVTNDIDTVANSLQQSISQIITSAISVIGILILMLTISPVLTLITLLMLPLSLFCTQFVVKRSQKHFVGQQSTLGELNGHVEEMYSGHNVIKAFGLEHKSIAEFEKLNNKLYMHGWKSQFISGLLMPLIGFIGNLAYIVIAVFGGFMALNGKFLVGDIQAFIQYHRQFTQPINQVANIVNMLQSTAAAAERVFDILDATPEVPETADPAEVHRVKGAVVFDHVRFGYTEDRILIQDMNIKIKPGQTVAIVGPTGAGKTTLVNLLMRFYELNSGKISIDGIDITQMRRSDLRNVFGMVLQDTWLFSGTIMENIRYGDLNKSDEEVVAAAKAAHAHHFIKSLPGGYQFELREDAGNISQGQRQLLTIARAILSDPDILILDEATSSVDTRTEILIQRAMKTLMENRTSFVIAHRLSTIRDADVILVMNSGDIVEAGNHQELMQKDGFYASLYNSQFGGEEISA